MGKLDLVSIRIDKKLARLTSNDSECCIFRVHTQLRNVNDKAYEPQLLAIGPYHRGKNDLRQMEEHKLRYLKLLLQRRNESSVERYIKAMRELEGRARRCYAETISLTVDEFVEMLLLDGCFIIELFYKFAMEGPTDNQCDPIFRLDWMLYRLVSDLVIFENQLPLFVLTKLMELTQVPNQQDNFMSFISIFVFLSRSVILPCDCGGQKELSDESLQNIRHLRDLAPNIEHLLALAYTSVTPYVEVGTSGNVVEWKPIRSATELQEAGVKFKELKTGGFLDIKFNNGVMEIPLLKIGDETESMFRNLIAYEQYKQSHYKYVTDYVRVMDYLINSPKDVELLRRCGIIENLLGDDEAISTMFNKLGDYVGISNFYYAEIFNHLNRHCGRRRNVWIAKLRHNYFNSPWALISFLAAVFLLLLTITQTIFSVLSYFVPKK